MPNNDDDLLNGPVPEPDTAASSSERAHAKTFAELVDKTMAGRTPPAMTADDRALLEVATVIRAASGKAELSAAKRSSLIEDALRQAVGGAGAKSAQTTVVPIERARQRRWVPWAIAAGSTLVAVAAVLLLWLRAPEQRVVQVNTAKASIPTEWKSRPADPLIGPIAREQVGDASARIDAIFADRLDGYRERALSGIARGRKAP